MVPTHAPPRSQSPIGNAPVPETPFRKPWRAGPLPFSTEDFLKKEAQLEMKLPLQLRHPQEGLYIMSIAFGFGCSPYVAGESETALENERPWPKEFRKPSGTLIKRCPAPPDIRTPFSTSAKTKRPRGIPSASLTIES